jgi:predicted ATPase
MLWRIVLVRKPVTDSTTTPSMAFIRRPTMVCSAETSCPVQDTGWHQQKMLALAHLGQRTAALAQYETCRHILGEELGVEPGVETKHLYERIRDEAVSSRGWPSQIAPDRAKQRPPAALPTSLPPLPLRVPAHPTPFIGREQELTDLNDLLTDPTCRLLTIIGPGGIGKTHLAVETARLAVAHFTDGVYFVSLAPLESTDSLIPTIAEALNFSFYEGANPQQQLFDYLRSKTMLLILDNFEHLLTGANLVTQILQAAPGLKILATSRERLKLRDEQLFHLSGIDFPTPKTLEAAAETSAVKLFVDSARRVQPDFTLESDDLAQIAEICRLVQGMPLAILLAAAWVELLTPAEIAAELGQSLDFLESEWQDVPNRHHSMRAVFDHSWGLLSEPERETFQQLSVFRGGFTRQAAQEVAGASLKNLRDLLNKSLLQPATSGRYQLHELLRQYAAEKLEEIPIAYQATRDRHCAHYVAILNEWETDFAGPRQQLALAEVDDDIKNVRSAWNWAVRQGKLEEIDLALESLYQFYWIRSRFQEGQDSLSQAAERFQARDSAPAENMQTRFLARQRAFC